MEKTKETNGQGRSCSGAVKASPHKKRRRLLFFQRNAHAQVTARGTGAFADQTTCNGDFVMVENGGEHAVKGTCTVTSSLGRTLTRRGVGRQGAPSPRTSSRRLAVMTCRRESS